MDIKEAAAYLAGMIDGEGSVVMVGKQTRSVVIVNTDTDLIDACAVCYEILGVEYHRYMRPYSEKNPKWNDKHIIQVFGQANIERIHDLVPIRSKSKRATLEAMMGSWRKPAPSKEVMERLYVQEGKSYQQIAQELGIKSIGTISRLVHQYGIEPRINANGRKANQWHDENTKLPVPLKEELERLYPAMSVANVAKHYSVSTTTVLKWLIHHQIPRAKPSINRK